SHARVPRPTAAHTIQRGNPLHPTADLQFQKSPLHRRFRSAANVAAVALAPHLLDLCRAQPDSRSVLFYPSQRPSTNGVKPAGPERFPPPLGLTLPARL